MNRARFAALVASSPAALALPARAADAPKQKITVTYGGEGMHYFPIYVARGAGFFAEEGLEVDWVNVNSGTKMAASIMGGSADFAPCGLIHAIKSATEGGNLVAIGTTYNVYAVQLVLSNDAMRKTGIKPHMGIDEKVKRMQGLRIGTSAPGSAVDVFVRSLFLARGYDPDKVLSIQPIGTGTALLAAFENKLSDGFAYPAPDPQIAVSRGLGKIVVDPFTGEVPELNDTCFVSFVTSKETIASKPAVVAGALRALAKGMRYARERPVQTNKLMRQYFPDLDQPVYDVAIETYRRAVPATPQLTAQTLQKTLTWMNLGSPAPVKAPYEAVFVPGPVTQAIHDVASWRVPTSS